MNRPIRIVSATQMTNIIDDPENNIGRYLSLESGTDGPILVACDNSIGEAFCEEFHSTKDAAKWLRGV